ncbi:MAG: tRNA pseudouridine(55) synthase TruB [bacterium]|nr:tRNA pseudouridine(55) synthase TruB [bacterium]
MQPHSSILLINKPPGPTSHDIVDIVRKKTRVKCVGHAGTLDPFAEGLLIVLVGRESTKRQKEFLDMDKTYGALIRLGAISDTDDVMGVLTEKLCHHAPSLQEIKTTVEHLIGTYEQMPPLYSSKKISGTPSHKLMRRGILPTLKPKSITVYSIDIKDHTWPRLTIQATVSSGTYIRSLARDIGEKLGCGAYVEKLTRLSIGPYQLKDAIDVFQK